MRSYWAKFILLAFASANLRAEPPSLMLWAWEQPVDLRFLAGRTGIGVAYLSATAFLDDRGVRVRYRGVPMRAPEGMYQMPVLRIEGRVVPKDLHLLSQLCDRLIRDGGSNSLQIDFDASLSLRDLYKNLVTDLRRRHGESLFLSMTVLAGWCDQPWFAALPVDERVVMLFRMGPAGKAVAQQLRRDRKFQSKACQGSLGYSLDETLAPQLTSTRRYWFSPKPWSSISVDSLSP